MLIAAAAERIVCLSGYYNLFPKRMIVWTTVASLGVRSHYECEWVMAGQPSQPIVTVALR